MFGIIIGMPLVLKKSRLIFLYLTIILVIQLADAVMAYTVPLFLEENLNSAFFMGLVLAASSTIGLFVDLIAGEWLQSKSYRFFIKWTLIISLGFPLSLLLLPRHLLVFMLAMFLWGIYYEFNAFSKYTFISKKVHRSEFSEVWGKLASLASLSYVVGPIIAINILHRGHTLPMWVAVILTGISFGLFALFVRSDRIIDKGFNESAKTPSIVRGFKVWGLLLRKTWPLVLFSVTLQMVEAFFWSIGIIYTNELGKVDPIGEYFVVAYIAPGIIFSYLAGKLTSPMGKKKTSLILGFIAGLLLSSLFLPQNIYLILFTVTLAAIFSSLSYPFLYAAFEDYVSRLGDFANDYIGVEQASSSMSYIIGPILGGYLSSTVGTPLAFSLAGMVLAIVSVGVFLIIPRKIRMPQKELLLIREA